MVKYYFLIHLRSPGPSGDIENLGLCRGTWRTCDPMLYFFIISKFLCQYIPDTCGLLIGIEGGKSLGVEPLMSAKEMNDDHVDHLSLMAYISKFQSVTPRKNKDEKLLIRAKLDNLKAGEEVNSSKVVDLYLLASGEVQNIHNSLNKGII